MTARTAVELNDVRYEERHPELVRCCTDGGASSLRRNTCMLLDRMEVAAREHAHLDSDHSEVASSERRWRNLTLATQLLEALLDFTGYLFATRNIGLPALSHALLSVADHHLQAFVADAIRWKLPVIAAVVDLERVVNRLLLPLADRQRADRMHGRRHPASSLHWSVSAKELGQFYEHVRHQEADVLRSMTGVLRKLKAADLRRLSSDDGSRSGSNWPANDDRQSMRDDVSLEKMIFYLDVALHSVDHLSLQIDCSLTDICVANRTVQRALQCLGEYTKNTRESRHLSATTRNTLMEKRIPLQQLLALRNAFSHTSFLLLSTQRNSLDHQRGELLRYRGELRKMRSILIDIVFARTAETVSDTIETRRPPKTDDARRRLIRRIAGRLFSGKPDIEAVAVSELNRMLTSDASTLVRGTLAKYHLARLTDVTTISDAVPFNVNGRNVSLIEKSIHDKTGNTDRISDALKGGDQHGAGDFSGIGQLQMRISGNRSEAETAGHSPQVGFVTDQLHALFRKYLFNEFETESQFQAFLETNRIGRNLQLNADSLSRHFQNTKAAEFLEIVNILEFYKTLRATFYRIFQMVTHQIEFERGKALELIQILKIADHHKVKLVQLMTGKVGDLKMAELMLASVTSEHSVYEEMEHFIASINSGGTGEIDYEGLSYICRRMELSERQCQSLKDMVLVLNQNLNCARVESDVIFEDIFRDALVGALPDLTSSLNYAGVMERYDRAKSHYVVRQQLKASIWSEGKLDRNKILELARRVTDDENIIREIRKKPEKKLKKYLRGIGALNKDPFQDLFEAVYKRKSWDTSLSCFTRLCYDVLRLNEDEVRLLVDKFTRIAGLRYKNNFFDCRSELEQSLRMAGPPLHRSDRRDAESRMVVGSEMMVLSMLNDLKDFPGRADNYQHVEYLILLTIRDRAPPGHRDVQLLGLRNWLAHGDSLVDLLNGDMTPIVLLAAQVLVEHGFALWELRDNLHNLSLETVEEVLKSTPGLNSENMVRDFVGYLRLFSSVRGRKRQLYLTRKAFSRLMRQDARSAIKENNLEAFKVCEKIIDTAEEEQTVKDYAENYLHLAASFGSVDTVAYLLHLHDGLSTNPPNGHGLTAACATNRRDVVRQLLDVVAGIDTLSPLHLSIALGHHQVIDELLRAKAPEELTVDEMQATLDLAIQAENFELVCRILRCIERITDMGADRVMCPLHVAVSNGRTDILLRLLQCASIARTSSQQIHSPFQHAAAVGSVEAVLILLENGADVNQVGVGRLTALHVASMYPSAKIVKILLAAGGDLFARDQHQRLPLHYAAKEKDESALESLIAADRSYGHLNAGDEDGITPLHFAVTKSHLTVATLLLNAGADPNSTDSENNTPLHYAAYRCDGTLVRLLLSKGSLTCCLSSKGITPLHALTKSDARDEKQIANVVNIFLENGVSINHPTPSNGWTPLFYAMARGNLAVINVLLSLGADTEISDKFRFTPLHFAVYNNHREAFRALVQHGADLNARNHVGMSPIHLASYEGCLPMVLELLNLGVSPDATTAEAFFRCTPLHLAAQGDHVDVVKLLLSRGHDVNIQNDRGFSALHLACHYRSHRVVHQLLQSESIDVEQKWGSSPITALHIAVMQGSDKIVNMLIKKKVRMDWRDVDGSTPMMRACQFGHLDIVQTFLNHCQIEGVQFGRSTNALHLAATHGHRDIVSLLLRLGKLPVDLRDGKDTTPLMSACRRGHTQVARVLLRHGAKVETRSSVGEFALTPLVLAVFYGRPGAARLLLEHGASLSNGREGGGGAQLLHYAADGGCLNNEIEQERDKIIVDMKISREVNELSDCPSRRTDFEQIVKLLLEFGADVDGKTHQLETALHLAARRGYTQAVATLLDNGARVDSLDRNVSTALLKAAFAGQLEVTQLLLDRGANVRIKNGDGFNALHVAVIKGQLEIVVAILAGSRADVNARSGMLARPVAARSLPVTDFYGRIARRLAAAPEVSSQRTRLINWWNPDTGTHAPLHFAASAGNFAIGEVLLRYGADVNVGDADGTTPLQLAAAQGHLTLCRLLLSYGADVNRKDNYGLAPLHIACSEDRPDVAALLVAEGANVQSYGTNVHPFFKINAFNLNRLVWLRKAITYVREPV